MSRHMHTIELIESCFAEIEWKICFKRDSQCQNQVDFEIDHSRSLKVKSKVAIREMIYGFLSVDNSNWVSISHGCWVISDFSLKKLIRGPHPSFTSCRDTTNPRITKTRTYFITLRSPYMPEKFETKSLNIEFLTIFGKVDPETH